MGPEIGPKRFFRFAGFFQEQHDIACAVKSVMDAHRVADPSARVLRMLLEKEPEQKFVRNNAYAPACFVETRKSSPQRVTVWNRKGEYVVLVVDGELLIPDI